MSNITTFNIETDQIGLKVVQRKGKKIVRESYVISKKDAEKVRNQFINEFWGNQLN